MERKAGHAMDDAWKGRDLAQDQALRARQENWLQFTN